MHIVFLVILLLIILKIVARPCSISVIIYFETNLIQ